MKMAFIVCNALLGPRILDMLHAAGIDYYTRWENATGKGRGTEPHLGTGSFGSTNTVFMIAFEKPSPLETLIEGIERFNAAAPRSDDRVRLFQMPLERLI